MTTLEGSGAASVSASDSVSVSTKSAPVWRSALCRARF